VGYSSVRLCQGGGGFEALPRPRLRLDLPRVADRLRAAGYSVTDARVMLIARREREVTIAQDGRILIKTRDAREAEQLLTEVRAFVQPGGPE